MSIKIAVTAASGNLGATTINQLKQEIGAKNIIGIARTPEKAEFSGVEIRKGDYNHKDEFVSALKGVYAVLLVSGMDHPDKRVQQHRNVIAAAKENGVKRIVYTSIIGDDKGNAFSPIVASNRQTEKDVRNSGLDWVIGRNGLYIEPDLEYLDHYIAKGEIYNSAADGKCAYTNREELAVAYSKMLLEDKHNGQTYNLAGAPVSQKQLVEHINEVYNTNLVYRSVPVDAYTKDRKTELGEFMGTVIGGIYEGIRTGAFDVESDFFKATGRQHKSLLEMMKEFKESKSDGG